jgi:hypothetical protein
MEQNPYEPPREAEPGSGHHRTDWAMIAVTTVRVIVAILVTLFFISLLLPA